MNIEKRIEAIAQLGEITGYKIELVEDAKEVTENDLEYGS